MEEQEVARSTTQTAPRYLIVCCDGTGNIWGNGHDTNVVKIARLLVKDDQQLLYYDPGVGTTDNFPPIGIWGKVKAYTRRFVGLALAGGIYQGIGRGYQFLVDNYRVGDRICLFGFSRGAFTVRSIAGIVDEFGIVRPAANAMVPILVRTYFLLPTSEPEVQGKRAAHSLTTFKRTSVRPQVPRRRSTFWASGTPSRVWVWEDYGSRRIPTYGRRITSMYATRCH